MTPAGYGHMTHMLMGLANGRVALLLEVSCVLNHKKCQQKNSLLLPAMLLVCIT